MSGKAMGAVWGIPLPHAEREVLLALADYADNDGENIYPDLALIVWKTDFNVRYVRRLMSSLMERGILIQVEKGGGRGNRTRYRIDFQNAPQKAPRTALNSGVAATVSDELNSGRQNSVPQATVSPLNSARQVPKQWPLESLNSGRHARAQSEPSIEPLEPREAPRANGVITPEQNAKVLAVKDELDARQLPSVLTGKDKQRIADCEADSTTIVDAYEALRSNKWGDVWCRGNASVGVAASNISTYLTTRGRGPNPTLSGAGYLNSELNDEMERLLGRRPQPDQRRLPGGT